MKKFFISIPKVLFAILCYLSALLLAILSGYFTVVFYSTSQSGWNMYAMAGLAGMLEFIKIMLAASYPFIQYRDIRREKKVSFYLKICFFLSVMASLNFFLTGGEIERSPASNITELLYTYIPILSIIPIKFTKFITTMSLSILVEAFIIFLPILAPIMFLEKDYSRSRKRNATTNWEKIKEIATIIPERFIDNLHKKVVGTGEQIENTKIESTNNLKIENKSNIEDNIKVIEMEKPKLKLLRNSKDIEELDNMNMDKIYNENTNINDSNDIDNVNDVEADTQEETDNIESSFVTENSLEVYDETDKQKLLATIYKYKNGNVCPSVQQLMQYTGLNKNSIHIIKKALEESGVLRTEGRKTILLCDYNDALERIWA